MQRARQPQTLTKLKEDAWQTCLLPLVLLDCLKLSAVALWVHYAGERLKCRDIEQVTLTADAGRNVTIIRGHEHGGAYLFVFGDGIPKNGQGLPEEAVAVSPSSHLSSAAKCRKVEFELYNSHGFLINSFRDRTVVRSTTPTGADDMTRRTTHRSKSGKKLYAVRNKKGEFKDIQTYKRAHGQDIKRRSKKEKRASS